MHTYPFNSEDIKILLEWKLKKIQSKFGYSFYIRIWQKQILSLVLLEIHKNDSFNIRLTFFKKNVVNIFTYQSVIKLRKV